MECYAYYAGDDIAVGIANGLLRYPHVTRGLHDLVDASNYSYRAIGSRDRMLCNSVSAQTESRGYGSVQLLPVQAPPIIRAHCSSGVKTRS